MAGLLVSYSDAVEGTFSQVSEGEHFYCEGYLNVRQTLDGTNTVRYTGDVERERVNLADDVPVRILKGCTVRPDDGTLPPPPDPGLEPPPEEIIIGSLDSGSIEG